jgi:two-component system, OmpR family, phosphate regulon response regulator PhoB
LRNSILLVDDEPDSLETLRLLLVEEGFDVRVASSGAEALERIGEALPDLLVLDVMMPSMTGLDLCRRLRMQADTRQLPCIAYSGSPLSSGAAHPYDRVLIKPTDFPVLLGAIRELLAARTP